ncbi:MAG: kelch repeat-containing protein [Elusimicrobia bacterium]|nr:kelch repeat-containing protein [Elusimicrobiota bacterium]
MKKNIFFSILLIISGFLVWKNVANNQFLYDDDTFIVLNENIRTLTPVAKFFSPGTSSNNPQMNRDIWRPLTTFSYALNYKLSGLNPKSFHLANLIIHLINGLLLFWLIFLITRKELPAFITAIVFLIHPVQAETVAWVSQRSNILFLFFYLLSLIFYIKHAEHTQNTNNKQFSTSYLPAKDLVEGFLLPTSCFILSLLSKEMAISLPLVILAYEYILNKQKLFSAFYRSFPYFAILFFFVLIRSTVIGQTAQTTYWAGGFIPQMLTMVKGFAYYIKLMFAPYPLSAEYLFSVKYAADIEVLICGFVLCGIIYLAWRLKKTQPILSFGIFLFFLSLAPVSNIIPIRTIINERFLYLAVAGFGLILGCGLANVVADPWSACVRHVKSAILVLPILILFSLYAYISINRTSDWHDHWSFVTANLKTCPQSETLHYGMGRAYASKGMFEEASKEFELCLKIDPQYDEATNDLGRIAAKTGNIDETISKYRQTVQKRVDFFDGLNNLGLAYFNKGNYEEAVKTLEKAVSVAAERSSAKLEAKTNLATAYAYYGDLDKAINLCKEILTENPQMEKTKRNLFLFVEAKKKAESNNVVVVDPWRADRKEATQGVATTNKNNNQVTRFVQEKFHDSVVQDSIINSVGVEFEKTKDGIKIKKAYLGSSQSKDSLKPAEVQALEAMKKREVGNVAAGQSSANPQFIFSENIKDGYTVKYNREEISVKHISGDSKAETESGVLVYKNAYQSTDILYVFENNQCQEMILLRDKTAPLEFEYEYNAKNVSINESGEINVSGLTLSKPVIFDATGKKVEGKWEVCNDNVVSKLALTTKQAEQALQLQQNDRHFVKLSFNNENLKYPVLIDPTWRTTNSMSTVRGQHAATLLPNGKVLITGGYNIGPTLLSTAELYDPSSGTFSTTGSMTTRRGFHTATLLPNGKVLITGGYEGVNNGSSISLSTAELYDPSAGTFSTTGSMSTARLYHTATLLPNGKVLITGGSDVIALSTAELYDPATGTFSTTGSMSTTRTYHTATLLPNAKVLIAGGYSVSAYLSTAELYDPSAGTFSTTGSMSTAKQGHTATLLPNGKVLIAGGYGTTYFSTAELYDPSAGTFSTTGSMSTTRYVHSATLLPSGKVLITGGNSNATDSGLLSTAELYDPSTGTFSTTGSMLTGRRSFTVTLLPNGKVFITGGWNNISEFLSTAELYDPSAGAFSATGSMSTARQLHTATLLPNGKVLTTGGWGGGISTAELYDPAGAGTFSTTGSMSSKRELPTATLLPNGKVLITGGWNNISGYLSTAELYDPSSGTFSTTGSMTTKRYSHTATLLPNGKVLIIGGNVASVVLSTAEIYDPAGEGTFSATSSMSTARQWHTVTLLPNGKVLITGGTSNGTASGLLSTAELYDPSAGTFSTTGSMTIVREFATATLLPNGKVLITGGTSSTPSSGLLSTAELYDPSVGTFSTTGSMTTSRFAHMATLLPNSKVLITGGYNDSAPALSTAELYDPSAGIFSTTNSMLSSRCYHTATLLPNGKVLIIGGWGISETLSTAELVRYTEYDYSVAASTMQPSIATVNGSGNFPVNVSKDTVFTLTGQRFRGYSEGSGGNYASINSPTNYPRVYLQKMNTGSNGSISEGGWLIDVTTSVYPMTSIQWQNADTEMSFKTPNNLASGFWLLSVMSNAIPSNGVVVNCVWPEPNNHAPVLTWTNEPNYTASGVYPLAGSTTSQFVYRVMYSDADNDAPSTTSPRVHIKNGGVEISGSPFTMTYVSGNYNTGAIYTYSKTGLSAGSEYTYYFETYDVWNSSAIGTPVTPIDAPDAIAKKGPTLSWTEDINYITDGLDPEIGASTNTYIYRVKYIHEDNDAPASGYPKLYIKKSGTNITGSPFTMTAVDTADTTYTDGKIYSSSMTLALGTDYTYYFSAYDVWNSSATGTPTTSIDAPDIVDITPPTQITNLTAATGSTLGTAEITWSAPSDEVGVASYILKYAITPISSQADFNNATTYTQTWIPSAYGTIESKTLGNLSEGATYYFAIESADTSGNPSLMSNTTSCFIKAITYNHFEVTAPTSVPAGNDFSITIAAKSSSNDTITSYSGTVNIQTVLTSNETRAGGGILGVSIANLVNGTVTISNQTYTKAENIKIRVTDINSITGKSSSITVIGFADNTSKLSISANPGTIITGQSSEITATLIDVYGNALNNVYVGFSVVKGSGSISASSVLTDTNGQAKVTFKRDTAIKPEVNTIRATVNNLTADANVNVGVLIYSTVGGTIVASEDPNTTATIPPNAIVNNIFICINTLTDLTIIHKNKIHNATDKVTGKVISNAVREFAAYKDDGDCYTDNFDELVNIKIPYKDDNNDNIADGTDISVDDLKIVRLDENKEEWKVVTDGQNKVDKANKVVEAQVQHFSIYTIGKAISVNLDNLKVYPNPVNFSKSVRNTLKFTNLPKNPKIKIYNVSGRLVRTLDTGTSNNDGTSGKAEWNGKNEENDEVETGLYIYIIEGENGDKKTGRIGVIK